MISDLKNQEISVEIPDALRESLRESLKSVKPDRAQKLQEIFDEGKGLQADKIWPRLQMVYCWLSGSVGRLARDVVHILLEGVKYMDIGYGASEGKFNVPLEVGKPYGALAAFSLFFEFLPLGEKIPVRIGQIEDGKCYELILTTFSGLYRYNIHDIVRVCGKSGNSPNIEFVCKASERLISGERTLYAKDFIEAIAKLEEDTGCFISFFLRTDSGRQT